MKSILLAIISLSYFNCSAQNLDTNFSDFIASQNKLELPYSTKTLTESKNVSPDYFHFEKGNDYFTLENLTCFGTFEKESIVFVVYGFDLIGEGELNALNMIILSSYDKTGDHTEDVILGGFYGGEGGAENYEKAIINENEIIIELTHEFYESDTGLSYPIIVYKKERYKFDEKYNLVEDTFRCDELESLEDYSLRFDTDDSNTIYGESHKLENYLHCFPINKENHAIYDNIYGQIEQSGLTDKARFLLNKLRSSIQKGDIIIASVDNLRVRKTSELKGEVLELLPLNSQAIYLGEKSTFKQEVFLNGEQIVDYWYKVKTTQGNIGWIHGCCISFQ